MEQKKCSKCGDEKLLTEFFFKNKKENKRHAQCKQCYRDSRKNKDHYEKYKDDYIERAKSRQNRLVTENRVELLNYFKTHDCVDCGNNEPIVLEFDHLKDKKFGISAMMRDYTWEQILKEISKCEVVCSNCHKKRTFKQFGWWDKS